MRAVDGQRQEPRVERGDLAHDVPGHTGHDDELGAQPLELGDELGRRDRYAGRRGRGLGGDLLPQVVVAERARGRRREPDHEFVAVLLVRGDAREIDQYGLARVPDRRVLGALGAHVARATPRASTQRAQRGADLQRVTMGEKRHPNLALIQCDR